MKKIFLSIIALTVYNSAFSQVTPSSKLNPVSTDTTKTQPKNTVTEKKGTEISGSKKAEIKSTELPARKEEENNGAGTIHPGSKNIPK